jgi:formylglycine-generating enzyme required for sulfatase activity
MPPPPPPPLAAKPTVYDGVPPSHRPKPPAAGLGKNTPPLDREEFAMSRRTRRINQAIMFTVLVGVIVFAALSYSAWHEARERAAQQRAAEERAVREEIAHSARADAPELAARKLGIPLEKTLAKSGIALRLIPAGSFLMGSPASEIQRTDNEVQHTVRISKPFYMGKYEVTQGQWQKVMGNNPSHFKNVGESAPVKQVSWNDCHTFMAELCKLEGLPAGSVRLPTEAEWEYACRAGTQTAFCYADDLDSSMANFDGNYPYGNGSKEKYRERTMSVGSFQPNAWGLYDMHGNVWEWCQDWYGPYGTDDAVDPRGSNLGLVRVLRGGGWYVSAWRCRSANRDYGNPDYAHIHFGFRLVLFACQ